MDVVLPTRRLVLRRPTLADATAIARYLNNFAVVGNLSRVPYPYRLADAEWWLTHQSTDQSPRATSFAIELPGAGCIGVVGFHADVREPTLGYWLGEPFWHRGFMTEAAAAAIGWYLGTTADETVYSGAFHFNKASLQVQKKLGFVEIGTSERHCLARGAAVRHIDTQLRRTVWAGART